VHISDHARGKLDPKSLKCTFIGYGGDEFGYRLWDDQNKKIIRSRDVIFNEKLMYKDRSTAQSTSPVQNDPVSTELADLSDSSVAQQVGEILSLKNLQNNKHHRIQLLCPHQEGLLVHMYQTGST
jgi:hypothetical protein